MNAGRFLTHGDARDALDILDALNVSTTLSSSIDGTEVRLAPTEDVAEAAFGLAEKGLGLLYDGHNLLVIDKRGGTPTEVVDEEGNPVTEEVAP